MSSDSPHLSALKITFAWLHTYLREKPWEPAMPSSWSSEACLLKSQKLCRTCAMLSPRMYSSASYKQFSSPTHCLTLNVMFPEVVVTTWGTLGIVISWSPATSSDVVSCGTIWWQCCPSLLYTLGGNVGLPTTAILGIDVINQFSECIENPLSLPLCSVRAHTLFLPHGGFLVVIEDLMSFLTLRKQKLENKCVQVQNKHERTSPLGPLMLVHSRQVSANKGTGQIFPTKGQSCSK